MTVLIGVGIFLGGALFGAVVGIRLLNLLAS